ncbi:tRNA (guanosine(46)-N7)-methyltransferase TrmB [Pseudonocardia sp. KRD291]|uniref:tRNA (guanosine(46)-N7)-methyltransferase TrmB n=1 Tax=Pseudonocardia sp. KRD291 TaxID=2792007 RepID=UPI0027E33A33|nr:tRNA (guanosine(46)-N7)-methyltransferase TrmB [Pseudonocardia sp. KRD291]
MPETDERRSPRAPGSRIRSFVHQRNRLSDGQQNAWDRWWPEYGRDVDDVLADVLADGAPWDPHAWFGRDAPVLLEIGSGMGETTAALAAAEPGTDHVAVEVFEPGLAQLLMRITDAELGNQRLLRGDAVDLLEGAVAPASLDGIRVYFPDPWPKRRHHKRRLVAPDFAALAASRIRDGGTLHLATDWPDYADRMREVCAAQPALRLLDESAPGSGWSRRPDWRPMTKFEARAVSEGRPVRDLLYTIVRPGATDDLRSVTG